MPYVRFCFFFSSRRRHTRLTCDWSSDVCSSDLYTLYGDSVYLIQEKKSDDGKTSLTVVRSFVQTGNRIEGRAEVLKGVKPGDRVVAVGQLKLQSGAAVAISTDAPPSIPAQAPRY